jgi:hypothetical protein
MIRLSSSETSSPARPLAERERLGRPGAVMARLSVGYGVGDGEALDAGLAVGSGVWTGMATLMLVRLARG